MIVFENPLAFIFLLAIPILYILRNLGIFSRISFPLTISDWLGKTFTYNGSAINFFSVISEILALLAYVALVLSLANPVIHHQEKVYTSRGTDILFVLDTSPSMAAKDISIVNSTISRIEAAKIGIKTLLNSDRGANYGLIAMASEAAVIIPPTNDKKLFLERLDSIVIGAFGEGSAIGTGLTTAIYHVSASKAPKKCIILITDGENNAGSVHPETAALLASENNITVYTFGIGTKGTVPIEYVDPKNGEVHAGFYESDFNEEPLETIASLSGGKYFGIESTMLLSDSLSEIARKENTVQTFRFRSIDENMFRTFLLCSIALFTLAWIIKRLFLQEIL